MLFKNLFFELNKYSSLSALLKNASDTTIQLHIEGVPGAGKTAEIVNLFVKLYTEYPGQVLLLVFNKAIQMEICHRILEKLPPELAIRFKKDKPVRTFDSIYYQIGKSCKYDVKPSETIIDRIAGKFERAHSVYNDYFLALRRGDYLEYLNLMSTSAKLVEVEELVQKKKLISFEMVPYLCLDKVLDGFMNKYKFVIVDEFQDVQPYMWPLLAGKILLTAGDTNQTIYKQMGADVKNSILAQQIAGEFKDIQITKRLPQAVLHFINTRSASYLHIAGTTNPERGEVREISTIEQIRDVIVSAKRKGESVMVLASIEADVNEILYSLISKTGLFIVSLSDMKTFGCFEEIALNPRYIPEECFTRRIFNKKKLPEWVPSKTRVGYYEYTSSNSLVAFFADEHASKTEEGYEDLKARLIRRISSAWDPGTFIVDKRFARYKPLFHYKIPSLAMIGEKIIKGELPLYYVFIGTYHSVKGTQADHVVVKGINFRNSLWTPSLDIQLALYVAITRARKKLYLYQWDSSTYDVLRHFYLNTKQARR